jgi:RsiW-degrading membrane proteinase PrsW (M82 family)
MRWFFVALVLLALASVALLLSNAGTSERYPLRVAGQVVVRDTPVTLVVLALFVGAGLAGLPLAVSNWWLRRRVSQLEKAVRRAQESADAARAAAQAADRPGQPSSG